MARWKICTISQFTYSFIVFFSLFSKVVFGEVVHGMDVVQKIENCGMSSELFFLAKSTLFILNLGTQSGIPKAEIVIMKSGIIQ